MMVDPNLLACHVTSYHALRFISPAGLPTTVCGYTGPQCSVAQQVTCAHQLFTGGSSGSFTCCGPSRTACLQAWVGILGVVFAVVVCSTPARFGRGCCCYAVTAHTFSLVASFVRMSRHSFPSGSCIPGIVSQGAHLRICHIYRSIRAEVFVL